MPKFNMYQSLHTTVIGPAGQAGRAADPHLRHAPARGVRRRGALEVQGGRPTAGVDTERARRPRRHGVAAAAARLAAGGRRPGRVPGVAALRDEPRRGLRLHPARRRRSRCRSGATPVDFAYAVHTEVGHRTHRRAGQRPARAAGVVARQRRRRRGLHLQGRRAPGPSRDWLGFVKSPRARSKIRQWFTKERREEAIERGKDADRQADAQGGPAPQAAADPRVADRWCASTSSYADVSALYAAVGENNLSAPGRRAPRHRPARRRRRRRRGPRRGCHHHRSLAAATVASSRRLRRRGQGRRRRVGQARQVLHAGAARPDPGLRHQGRRSLGAPPQTAPTPPASTTSPSGCSRWSGRPPPSRRSWSTSRSRPSTASRLLSDITMALSDAHVNILSATLTHEPRPGRQEPLHLRDGRRLPPRQRAPRRARRPRRLRRLPRHPVTRRADGDPSGRAGRA